MKSFFRAFCTVLLLSAVAWLTPGPAGAQTFDLVIRNGRLIDGTGNPAYFADLGIKDGRISRIGRIAETAANEVDARGTVVAPGFIDVHAHGENILKRPDATNFARMGVTTIVNGNCGTSVTNVARTFARMEEMGIGVNVLTLIGHNTVRKAAMMGSFDREASAAEWMQMKEMVEQAMKDGAFGLSTGLIYLPGTFTKTEEIIELAKIASAYDGIYVSHMRSEGQGVLSALDELIRIAREAHKRAHVSHIKLSGPVVWGRAAEVIAVIDKARADGLDITQDQYGYTAASNDFGSRIPAAFREGGRDRFVERLKDPATKAQIIEQMKKSLAASGNRDYSYAQIARYGANPKLNGKNIMEAARILRGSDSLDDQIETILTFEATGGASGVFHGVNEDDVKCFMSHPNTMFGSDSDVRQMGEGVPHPRGYGNNARILGRYVRDEKVLRLEDAIRRMTSLPAQTFRLKDRGTLREGMWADVVVFDPGLVKDLATYTDPHQYPQGISHVFVNGTAVLADHKATGAKPGVPIRRK